MYLSLKEQTNRKTDEKQEVKLEKLFTGLYSRLDTIIEVLGHMAGQQKEAEHIKPSNLLIPHTPPQPRPIRKAVCIMVITIIFLHEEQKCLFG